MTSVYEGKHPMTLLLVLILLSLISTIIALVIGLAVMSQGGELDMQLSNKLMQARVWLQGLTVFLLLVAVLVL